MFTMPVEILTHCTRTFTKLAVVDICWMRQPYELISFSSMLILTDTWIAFNTAEVC